MELFKIIK